LSILNTITVPTVNDGALLLRLESRIPNPSYEGVRDAEVWSAEGTDVHGRKQRGFGGDPVEAVVDVLQALEIVRQEQPQATPFSERFGWTNAAKDPEHVALGERLFGPGSSESAGQTWIGDPPGSFQPQGEAFHPLSSFDKSLDNPVYQDLPDEFWEAIRDDKKIIAIKELRTATGLSLKSSKALVDYIIPAGKSGFTARGAIVGTVIRIHGKTSDHVLHRGWVFEKDGEPDWSTTDFDDDYSDRTVQAAMDKDGFDILFIPRPRVSAAELRRSRMEIESDQA
jgi:hypothetical protein